MYFVLRIWVAGVHMVCLSYPVQWHGIALSTSRITMYQGTAVLIVSLVVVLWPQSLYLSFTGTGWRMSMDTGCAGCRRVKRITWRTHTLAKIQSVVTGQTPITLEWKNSTGEKNKTKPSTLSIPWSTSYTSIPKMKVKLDRTRYSVVYNSGRTTADYYTNV